MFTRRSVCSKHTDSRKAGKRALKKLYQVFQSIPVGSDPLPEMEREYPLKQSLKRYLGVLRRYFRPVPVRPGSK
jgi:hypothetical protein